MKTADLKALKETVSRLERGSSPVASGRFGTGSTAIDATLSGGLARGAVHEIFAAEIGDGAAAAGFTIALALRAAGARPVLWVRQDFVGLEMGEIHPPGLVELGLSPDRLIVVRARDGPGVLKAGEEAARCPPLGAVLVEPWGNPKTLDLAASRRLALAAARSNLPLFMLRIAAHPMPSAAMTRWDVRSAPSQKLEANAPGHPAFAVTLLRHRAGTPQRSWIVEWDRDGCAFNDIETSRTLSFETLSFGMASLPAERPPAAAAEDGDRRRAG